MNTVTRFTELFRGRGDCYGSWDGLCVKEPVTRKHFGLHLTGNSTDSWMGVYPHLGAGGDQQCSWGCIDIDGADFPLQYGGEDDGPVNTLEDYDRKNPQWHDWDAMFDLATNLVEALEYKDVNGYIERTRNGYHVWIFPENPPHHLVPARVMRRALMAACSVCDFDPKEVNPKQEALEAGRVGNYVRLPYYGCLAGNVTTRADRYFLDDIHDKLTVHGFLDFVQRTPVANLEAIARLWTPPPVEHDIDPAAGMDAEPYLTQMDGLSYRIWRDGPLPGKDRSSTLAQLAHLCAEQGFPMQIAYTIVASADQRWGKFHDRDDGVEQLTAIVERAYAS